MTKHTDTMSGAWPLKPQTYYQCVLSWNSQSPDIVPSVLSWNGQAPCMVSVGFVMKWSSPMHSISLLCNEMAKSHAWYQCVLTISWQNRLMPCMELDHFMTKQTDTMSGDWPFHEITKWYYAWSLTISWQNWLILCLRLDHFMTKQTDTKSPDIVSVCFVMKW
jgi:hypothetical protein